MMGIKHFLLALCIASSAADIVLCHLTIRAEQLSVWDNGGQYDVNVANTFPGHILLTAVLQVESQVQIAQIWGAEQVGTCPPPLPKDGRSGSRPCADASCVLVSPTVESQCLGVKAQTGESWNFAFALVSSVSFANFTSDISARVFAVARNFTRTPFPSTTPFPRHKLTVRQRPGRMRLEDGETVVVPWVWVLRSHQESEWIERLSLSIPCEGGADTIRDLWGARLKRVGRDCRLVVPDDVRIAPGGTYEVLGFNSIVNSPEPLSIISIRTKSDKSTE